MAGRLKIYNSSTGTWDYVSTPNGLASASDIDSGTDTSKSLTPAAVADSFIGGKDGWVKLPACAYRSATSIEFAPGTLPIDGPNVGAKIKLTNGSTVKYFIVTSVATDGGQYTILGLSGMNGATVANSAITLPYYSLMASPRLFPGTVSILSSPTLTTAFKYESVYSPLVLIKDNSTGIVTITGTVVSNASNLSNTTIIPVGGLPVAYRPPAIVFANALYDGYGGKEVRVDIRDDGAVVLYFRGDATFNSGRVLTFSQVYLT